jgi:Subtilisin inhibitor-like
MGRWRGRRTAARRPRTVGRYGTTAGAAVLLLTLAACTGGPTTSGDSTGDPAASSSGATSPSSQPTPSSQPSSLSSPAPSLTSPAQPLGPGTASPTPTIPATPDARSGTGITASLTITLRATATAEPVSYTLVCNGASAAQESTLPEADTACAELEAHGEDVLSNQRPMPEQCTQQYGGPQQATVTGTFHGRSVDASFTLTDGCRIALWNSIPTLLGGPAGTN